MRKTSIDVIIPVYYAPELTIRCAESVVKTTNKLSQFDIKIILVDDSESTSFSSILGNLARLRNIHDKIEIITRKKNGGFIEACYTGIEFRESDYKLLLNSDTLVLGNWLEEMVRTAESDDKIALVNPNTNSTPVINTPMPRGSNILMMQKYFENCQFSNYDEIDIVTCVGFCLLIKSKYIKKYGFFDRIYDKGYAEETDLHFRYTKNGLRSVLSPKAFVYHVGEASFTDRDERVHRNRKIFLERYSKEYYRDFPKFQEKTVLNIIRQDILINIKYNYDYIFLVENNDYFNPDYYFAAKLANQLLEKGISCGIVVNELTDKRGKIEDNLFKEIEKEEFSKKDFDTNYIISDKSNIENAIKLSVISRSFKNLLVLDGGQNTLHLFDFEEYKTGNKILSLPYYVSLENINSFLKGKVKTNFLVLFDEKTSENILVEVRTILKDQNTLFVYSGIDGNKNALLSKDFAESELLKVVNSSKALIDLRHSISINDLHVAFLLNGCKIYSSSIDISNLDEKFLSQIYHIDELKKDFASRVKSKLDNSELIQYSIRFNIDSFNITASETELSTKQLRHLFYKYYKLTREPKEVTYVYVEGGRGSDTVNRIRYRIIDKIISKVSKVPYTYDALKFIVKLGRKIKRMLKA